jgi:hypothetical protein
LWSLQLPAVFEIVLRRALPTGLRCEVDDHIHALGGHERPMVPRMPGLTAGPAPTLHAPTTLTSPTGEAIG